MNALSSTATPGPPDDNDASAKTKPGTGPFISACVPAEAWFMHITQVDSYSSGNARVTETSYHRFTTVFTPEGGPPGWRCYDASFRCPHCQVELDVQLAVRTCLAYSRQSFRSAVGRQLRKFLLARRLREWGVGAIIGPPICAIAFGVLGAIVATFSSDKDINFRNGIIFGFGMGVLILLGILCHILFKLVLASEGKVSINKPRDIPPDGLDMVKVFVEEIIFDATDEMGKKNKFHCLLAEPPKPNAEDRFVGRIKVNESF